LFYSVGIGYKRYSNEYSYGYRDYLGNYRQYTSTISYDIIPITINGGITGKTFLERENLPINPYVSFGLAYLPPNDFDQLGFNLSIGVVYNIPELHGIGLGLEYHYFESLTGWTMSFSNLNLSVLFNFREY